MKNLIELKGITKSFPTGDGILPVLKDINLSVRRGEFVTIVGSSGSGKSTLMNIIGLSGYAGQRRLSSGRGAG